MKKAFLILLLLIILFSVYIVYIFKDYKISHGCVIVTAGFQNDSQISSILAGLDNENEKKCADPFVVDISRLDEDGQNGNKIVRDINGIRFFLGMVIPENKDDDSIAEKDDSAVSQKESGNEKPVRLQVIESVEDSDIAIYLIKGDSSKGFSAVEVEDAVVNIQAAAKKVDIIVTSDTRIPKEKIIKTSTQLINITENERSAVVIFSVIEQASGEKVVTRMSGNLFKRLFGQF